jgi:hypothetical protein
MAIMKKGSSVDSERGADMVSIVILWKVEVMEESVT